MDERYDEYIVGIGAAIIGAIVGVLIGYSFDMIEPIAIAVAVYMGIAEGVTHELRQPGQLKPLWHRVVVSTLVGAGLGVLIGLPVGAIPVGIIMGFLVGLLGLGPRKFAVGVAVGVAMGVLSHTLELNDAITGGGVVLGFRLLIMVLFNDSDPLQVAGEDVAPQDARFVVPFEAHTKIIGAQYMEQLAVETAGFYARNRPDIGVVESLDALAGPHFDPAAVHPLIREFYEHTSRFKLSIVPQWQPLIKPFFWLFKSLFAQRIQQANLPFNQQEAQRGMVSYIDTIDYQDAEHIRTLRGWVRAYEGSGEAIYVGIYTVVRHDEVGYVSVGFPLPESNFTATLLPHNHHGDALLLKSENPGVGFTGHYISFIDDGKLTILKVVSMKEEIEVFVREDALYTDHRFYFGNYLFLTLHYTIERKPTAPTADSAPPAKAATRRL